MKNYFVFSLLFISTSVLANTDIINSKFHNPHNKKVIQKVSKPAINSNRIINPKFHHPDNKEHHVIKKTKKIPASVPAL